MPAPKKSETWLRGRKRLGKLNEWKAREERARQCVAWKAHIPGILDSEYPVARAVRDILDANLDPQHRSERQLHRVIADVRSHYGNIGDEDALTSNKDHLGGMPWEVFEGVVAENVDLFRDIVTQLSQIDPETVPPDTLLDVTHLLDRAIATLNKPRRPSVVVDPGEFG